MQVMHGLIGFGPFNWMTTGNFQPNWTAAGLSAIPGLIKGFAGGIDAVRHGGDFWTGINSTYEFDEGLGKYEIIAKDYNTSSEAELYDELLKIRMQEEFSVTEGNFKIQKITTKTGIEFGMTNTGKYINLKTGRMVGGYIKYVKSFGHSEFHLSPYYSIGDIVNFRAIAGHELIHAYHYSALPIVRGEFTERVAYRFTYNTYISAGQFDKAFSVMHSAISNPSGLFWGSYPIQYQIPSPFKFYY
jgi:hypothetical protein